MRDPQEIAGQVVDLSKCDSEPIHIPGRIQPHGALVSLSEPDLIVLQASENVAEFLGVPVDDLLGSRFDALFAPEHRAGTLDVLRSDDPREGGAFSLTIRVDGVPRTFDASAFRGEGSLIVELENPRPGGPRPEVDHSRSIRRAMARFRGTGDLLEFCRIAVGEMRDLTGFDRVTVYRFDADWNGVVYAEDCRDDLDHLLSLHFPASDIPEQARRLYTKNLLRQVSDVSYDPVPIVPRLNPADGLPLDLTFAAMRSVSPIHLHYLKNMGATASLSVSLICDGRLWGLLSCMHYSGPKYVPPNLRAASAFLGDLISLQLGVKEESGDQGYQARVRGVREALLRHMADAPDLVEGLMDREPNLLDLVDARGAAILVDGRCALLGSTPAEADVKRLVQWLKVHTDGEVFQTDSLPRLFPEAEAYQDRASGLISIATSKAQGLYVLWFRPEVIQTVDWGGDPRKAVGPGTEGMPLTPRTSFELWKEVVRRKSLPWKGCEVDAARGLRDAILAVVVRRAEDLTRLNAELERSNTDLDSFAYIASHDLKEPLRGIHNYASFLLEDYLERLDEDGVSKLRTLVRLSRRMEDLIESLLRYSQVGREGLSMEEVDLQEVVEEVLDNLSSRLDGPGVEVRVPRPLGRALCDRTGVGEIFANLVANALKYNDKAEGWVEVGFEEPISPLDAAKPRERVYYVRDNGIGIPEKHLNSIFRLFKRLHGRDKFGGGTGAGLTIARKIVERHGGTIWVESTPGAGSTFYFTLRG